jgi:PAS domain S-box-containing protein
MTSEPRRLHSGERLTAADCLRQFKAVLIERWKLAVQKELPAAKNKSSPLLIDSLPAFIDELCDSLDPKKPYKSSVSRNAHNHAMQRAAIGDYDIKQVLIEYQILRKALLEILDQESDLTIQERDTILDLFHEGITAAAEQYSKTMIENATRTSVKLQQTEERLRLALEFGKIGVFDLDFSVGELVWSDRMQELWAYGPGEFTGKVSDFYKRVHPEDLVPLENAIQLSFEKKQPFSVTHRVVWPDGSVHWISVQGQISLDKSGKLSHVAGVALEVTKRIESEHRLRISEEIFRLASRATQDLIWDWDITRNKIRWNDALSLQFGYPEDLRETTLDWWVEHLHPEDQEKAKASIQQAVETGLLRWKEEYRFKDGDGHYRVIVDRGFIVRDGKGKATRMVGAMQDITAERKAQENLLRATEALERSEERYRTIFENAPVGMAEVDPISRRFLRVNPKYCTMLGLTSEELLQLCTSDVTLPEDRELDTQTALQLLRGEKNEIRHEKRYVRKDGSTFWVELSVSTIRCSNGEPKMNIAAALDISKRKEAEENLIRALQQLQNERTVRERFVFALTHDLRQPLTAAKTSTQLALRSASDADRVTFFSGKTIDALNRTDRMIQDLLDVSRLNAGQLLAIAPGECNISQVVREVCEELTVTYGVNCQTEIPPKLIGFWSCAELRRAIENLGSNAAKYGDTTRPITIRIIQLGEQIELQVHNFGNPISKEDQPHLFDSFLRSRTATGKSKGWGLGLNLVKGVAEAHHGTVRVESSLKDGTTFSIILPVDVRWVRSAS